MNLADFVRKTREEKNLSLKDVEDRSRGRISRGYVNQIENGQVVIGTISLDKLEALADGLGTPAIEVFRIAHNRDQFEPKQRREILVESFGGEDLSQSDLEEIERTIDFLIEQKRRRLRAAEIEDTVGKPRSK